MRIMKNAELKAEVDLRNFSGEDKDGYEVKGYLYDAEGNLVTQEPLSAAADFGEESETSVTLSGQITNPAKWTAEHPNLYTLVLVPGEERRADRDHVEPCGLPGDRDHR